MSGKRFAPHVWCGVKTGVIALFSLPLGLNASEIFLFANRKSYFLSVISGCNVKTVYSFHNNINKQFHMSVCQYGKLVGLIMPNLSVIWNCWMLPLSTKNDLIAIRCFVCNSLTLLNLNFCKCYRGINFI